MASDERRALRREDAGPETLEASAVAVESIVNRSADVIQATARAVRGDRLELYHDEDVQSTLAVAAELKVLADRALCARTGGA